MNDQYDLMNKSQNDRSHIGISMPSDYRCETIAGYSRLATIEDQDFDVRVTETFGSLNPEQGIPSARGSMAPVLPKSDENSLAEYIKFGHQLGIRFNYVLNGVPTPDESLRPRFILKVLQFIERLMHLGIDSITLSDSSVIRNVRHTFPHLPVTVSVVTGIDSVSSAIWFIEHGVSRIVLSERVNREFQLLKNVSKLPCEFSLQLNAKCTLGCPIKRDHFALLSSFHSSHPHCFANYFTNSCDLIRQLRPWDILRTTFIRPEDLKVYQEHGIYLFKFIGREWVEQADFQQVFAAYRNRNFDGSLYSLLDAFRNKNQYPYLSNKALSGFLDYFVTEHPDCRSNCGISCHYCKKYYDKLAESDRWLPDSRKASLLRKEIEDFLNASRSMFLSSWKIRG